MTFASAKAWRRWACDWIGLRPPSFPSRGRPLKWKRRGRRPGCDGANRRGSHPRRSAPNRAREGLRVVEDYCRFVLDDSFLCGELKQLRHDFTAALASLPAERLLEARETQSDVGVLLSTEAEQERSSLAAVALANWKRLQEALCSSLEEFGKTVGPDLGPAMEQLRYRSYTLERAATLGAVARERLADARLCLLLTGLQCVRSLEETVKEATAGGVGMIQLRKPGIYPTAKLLERAREVRGWAQRGRSFVPRQRPAGCRASRGVPTEFIWAKMICR